MNLNQFNGRMVLTGLSVGSLFGLLLLNSCSTGKTSNHHVLHRILLYNLHFRRPDRDPANPAAFPGENDYKSHPLPDAHLDCEPLSKLFDAFDLASVRVCLKSFGTPTASKTLTYTLKRDNAPFLTLATQDESLPACFSKLLDKIPVPREIFFQSREAQTMDKAMDKNGSLNCYSSKIWTESTGGLKLGSLFSSFETKISFPLASLPRNDQETLLLLGTWALSPFVSRNFDSHGEASIQSEIVPSSLCRQCMGEQNLYLDSTSLPVFWPNAE